MKNILQSLTITPLINRCWRLLVHNDDGVASGGRGCQGGTIRVLDIQNLGIGNRYTAARAGAGGVGESDGAKVGQPVLAAVDNQVLHDPLDGGAAERGARVRDRLGEGLAVRLVLHDDAARRVVTGRSQVDHDDVAGRDITQVDDDSVLGVPSNKDSC